MSSARRGTASSSSAVDRVFRLEWDSEGYWVDLAVLDEQGETVRVRRPIVMTTGSHHMQLFWLATGHTRQIALLPFAYLFEEERWLPRDSVFLKPPRPEGREVPPRYPEGSRWNQTCIQCHSTHGPPEVPRPSARPIWTRVSLRWGLRAKPVTDRAKSTFG